jgi:hypothetical protein
MCTLTFVRDATIVTTFVPTCTVISADIVMQNAHYLSSVVFCLPHESNYNISIPIAIETFNNPTTTYSGVFPIEQKNSTHTCTTFWCFYGSSMCVVVVLPVLVAVPVVRDICSNWTCNRSKRCNNCGFPPPI